MKNISFGYAINIFSTICLIIFFAGESGHGQPAFSNVSPTSEDNTPRLGQEFGTVCKVSNYDLAEIEEVVRFLGMPGLFVKSVNDLELKKDELLAYRFQHAGLRALFDREKANNPVLYGYESVYTRGIAILPPLKGCNYPKLHGPPFVVLSEFVIVGVGASGTAVREKHGDKPPQEPATAADAKRFGNAETSKIKGVAAEALGRLGTVAKITSYKIVETPKHADSIHGQLDDWAAPILLVEAVNDGMLDNAVGMEFKFKREELKTFFEKEKLKHPVLYGYENVFTCGLPKVPMSLRGDCDAPAGPKFRIVHELVIVDIEGAASPMPVGSDKTKGSGAKNETDTVKTESKSPE